MTDWLRRLTPLLCVVFCCTFACAAAPAHAQPLTRQTFTLNGMAADVIRPQHPVRLGGPFQFFLELRAHGAPALTGITVVLDGRPLGYSDGLNVPPGIGTGIPNEYEWYSATSIDTTPGDVIVRITVTEAAGRGGVIELPVRLLPVAVDADNDTLPDDWEGEFGLSTQSASQDDGPDGDPDGDGVRNHDEFLRSTHPRGFHTRYFPEGVAGDGFFGTSVTHSPLPGGSARVLVRTVDARGLASWNMFAHNLLGNGETTSGSYQVRIQEHSFATIIESDAPFAAERMTWWPATFATFGIGYGSHASEGAASLSTRWLFAEGVTGAFHTYVSLVNPSAQTARVTVTYLGVDGVTPIVREHYVAPDRRATIDVNADAAGLASLDLAIVIDSDVPIAAERSIYRDVGANLWGAGTSSIGAPAPAAAWFFAEGLSNPLFDTYVLLLNPGTTAARIEIDVLQANGAPITLTRTLAPRSRATVYLNDAIALTGPAASSSSSYGLAVRSLDGAPIVAERTTWWNDPLRGTRWVEGHTSMGTPAPATRWFAPQNTLTGAAGGVSVYLLLANPGATPATVRVTAPAPFQTGMSSEVMMTVPAGGRVTLDVTAAFVWQLGRPDGRFTALLVESIGDTPVPIVAERSIYANTHDAVWELGSNALLTPLPPQ